MPEQPADKPLYAELVTGVFIPLDTARDMYEYLGNEHWQTIAAALRQLASEHRNTIWSNNSATMPEIDRARGRTNALESVADLREVLRESIRNPVTTRE